MALTGFKAQNHPQQTGKRGAKPEVDNLATPPEMFAPFHDRFRFTIDVAALPHNTKLERYFAPPGARGLGAGARGINGLECSWAGERVWCNPPYSEIEPWVQKAWEESARADLIVMLLPANRPEQGWWQRWVEPYRDRHIDCGYCGSGQWPAPTFGDGGERPPLRVEFIAGRPRFIKHGFDKVEPNQRPPFGCCLLIWGAA